MQIYSTFIYCDPVLFKPLYNSVHFGSYLPPAGKDDAISAHVKKAYKGNRGISSTHSYPRHKMDLSVQLDSPAALPRETTPVPIEQEVEWGPTACIDVLEKRKNLSLSGAHRYIYING